MDDDVAALLDSALEEVVEEQNKDCHLFVTL